MDLHKFPFDTQTCPIEIASFGHSSEDIIYKVPNNLVIMAEWDVKFLRER